MRAAPCLLALALAASGCARVHVTSEAAPGVDFARLRTFAHASDDPDEPIAGEGRLVRGVVREQIESELEARGYRPAPRESADMLVAFQARGVSGAKLKQAPDPDANYYVVRNYVEGTLVIDIFEPGRADAVWHGVGRVDIGDAANAEKGAARAVKAVLAEFPPASPGS